MLAGLRRLNPLFEGFAQQDAHEALRAVLADIHEKLAVDVLRDQKRVLEAKLHDAFLNLLHSPAPTE